MREIYLDHAASAPLKEGVLEAMLPWLSENIANPDGVHPRSRAAAKAVFDARKTIADRLNVSPSEIYFTSGGTESDNWAITGALTLAFQKMDQPHVVTSAFEHPAVLRPLEKLHKAGKIRLSYVSPGSDGLVSPEAVEKLCAEDTALISVMHVNNEIGTIQPIEAIGSIARERKILFHTDAVQSVGHLDVFPPKAGISLLSASAHKFGGPKGIGFLYLKQNTGFPAMILGGGQESGRRGGTLNVPGIVGMATALSIKEDENRIKQMQKQLYDGIALSFPNSCLNGSLEHRIGGNLNFCFPGQASDALLLELGKRGIYASGRAACSSTSEETSHVLRAIGRSDEEARSAIRFSLGDDNSEEDIDFLIRVLREIIF